MQSKSIFLLAELSGAKDVLPIEKSGHYRLAPHVYGWGRLLWEILDQPLIFLLVNFACSYTIDSIMYIDVKETMEQLKNYEDKIFRSIISVQIDTLRKKRRKGGLMGFDSQVPYLLLFIQAQKKKFFALNLLVIVDKLLHHNVSYAALYPLIPSGFSFLSSFWQHCVKSSSLCFYLIEIQV